MSDFFSFFRRKLKQSSMTPFSATPELPDRNISAAEGDT